MATTEHSRLTAVELLEAYAARRISPVEAMESVLARSAAVNPSINAFFHVVGEAALEQARASERRWAIGAPAGALDGVRSR